jgi:hypothetical protein
MERQASSAQFPSCRLRDYSLYQRKYLLVWQMSDEQGKKAGFHRGGYFRFWLDVTDYIKRGQKNELVVFVYDPTDSEGDVASMS